MIVRHQREWVSPGGGGRESDILAPHELFIVGNWAVVQCGAETRGDMSEGGGGGGPRGG